MQFVVTSQVNCVVIADQDVFVMNRRICQRQQNQEQAEMEVLQEAGLHFNLVAYVCYSSSLLFVS